LSPVQVLGLAWTSREKILDFAVSPDLDFLQQGRIKACLFLVHGGKVRRVIMADELLRVMRNEIPEIGTRPNSQAQKLWDRIVAHGKAGAKAKAKKKAERSGPGPGNQ